MKLFYTFFLGLALLASLSTGAQIKLEKAPGFVKDPSISDAQMMEITALTEAALNEYATTGRIFDTSEKRVNNTSIKAFNELFTPSAEVVKDFVEFPPRELVDFRDYSIEVYNLLSDKGVQFQLKGAQLKEIRVRTLGSSTFYLPVVKVNKVVYSYLDRYGALKQSTTGKNIELLMSFDIYSDDMTSASIAKIEHGVSVKPADDYNRLINIYAMAGVASYSPTYSEYWNEGHSNTTMNISSGVNWGLGIDFMTDQFITAKSNSERKIGWAAGLRFSQSTIDLDVPEFTTGAVTQTIPVEGTSVEGQRLISTGNINQTATVSFLSLPFGVDYKLMKTRTMIVALHGRVVPSLAIASNSTLSGTILNDVYFPEYDLTISDPNSGSEAWGSAADAGVRNFEIETTPELNNFVLGFELSPTAYFNFEDTDNGWGIYVGADIGFIPQSFIVQDPIESVSDESLSLSSDVNPLISSYFTDFTSMQFGLRVGLFHRNVTQP